MTKQDKITLLRNIQKGNIQIIEGKILHDSLIIFTKLGRYFWDNECIEEIKDMSKLNKKNMIFLPFNNR